MFTKEQLRVIWLEAGTQIKRAQRKTIGANDQEKKTMSYAMAKEQELLWKNIHSQAAKYFISYIDDTQWWASVKEATAPMYNTGKEVLAEIEQEIEEATREIETSKGAVTAPKTPRNGDKG